MRLKFFQSQNTKASLDDSSFSSSSTSQSSWHSNNNQQQQQRAVTEPRRGVSPYVQQQQQEQQQNRPKTLGTVMQLFEENPQHTTAPTTSTAMSSAKRNHTYQQDPYRIKANGAVVINRSNNLDNDDLLLGSTSATLSSHISTASSFDASTFISQPIVTDIGMLDQLPQQRQNDAGDDETTKDNNGGGGAVEGGTIPSSTFIEPVVQQPKMRMESNSSRSTFPSHDTTRFSIDSISLRSMESWSSSVDNHLPEEGYPSCEPEQHHVTALSPPPRDPGKKWHRGRTYSNDGDDACEALTALNSDHHAITSDITSSHQEQQGHCQDHHHYHQKDSLNKWRHMFELADQENARLRQQIQTQQNEHIAGMCLKNEALADARRENKYLRGALSRIQLLSNTDAAYNKEKRRRQSTGEIAMVLPAPSDVDGSDSSIEEVARGDTRELSMTLSKRGFHGSVALSYERKIRILLDEIEGMQAEEETMHMRRSKLAIKNSLLEQQLLAREEYIKQLKHDLRIMRLQCQ